MCPLVFWRNTKTQAVWLMIGSSRVTWLDRLADFHRVVFLSANFFSDSVVRGESSRLCQVFERVARYPCFRFIHRRICYRQKITKLLAFQSFNPLLGRSFPGYPKIDQKVIDSKWPRYRFLTALSTLVQPVFLISWCPPSILEHWSNTYCEPAPSRSAFRAFEPVFSIHGNTTLL